MIKRSRSPDGKLVLRRPAYDPRDYTIAPERLAELQRGVGNWGYDEAMNDREGMFKGWIQVERFRQDGKEWALLYAVGSETVIEVELKPGGAMGEVRAVPAERTYEIAKRMDAKLRPDIIYE